jgi:hypothetical protein
MHKSYLLETFIHSVFILAIGLVTTSVVGIAEEEPAKETQSEEKVVTDQASDMEIWKEYATPNENHKVLDVFVGSWDYTVKWWSSPNSEPEISQGTSEVKWIMGGRFLEHTAKGTSMGQPFEGMGITGYDNARNEYVSVWIDNMGTGVMVSSGKYDASTKTFEEKGKFTQPKMGETTFRGVTKITNDDDFVYEIFTKDKDWQEYKALEIEYKRKKQSK